MKQQINIFSLDYDGSADVLFKQILKKYSHPTHQKLLLAARQHLLNFLIEINEKGDATELYVGSNRQDISIDNHNHTKKNGANGLCFQNYPILAKEHGWIFRELLLADVDHGLPPGTAMHHEEYRCKTFDENKIKTLQNQFIDAAKNHPDAIINFYFIDDDGSNKIFPALIQHFGNHPEEIPKNIKLNMIQFDWYGVALEGKKPNIVKGVIQGTGSIPGKVNKIPSIASLAIKYSPLISIEYLNPPHDDASSSDSSEDLSPSPDTPTIYC